MRNFLIVLIGLTVWSCKPGTPKSADSGSPAPLRCAPPLADIDWYSSGQPAPLFNGMDQLHFPITTTNPDAQKYFNQGLLLAYAFNHAESARSFFHATRLDSTCAMCHWGFAYVLGPNYNAGMEPDNYERAYKAIQQAMKYSASTTPKEKAMINAMARRYTPEAPEDRYLLDSAYMEAMKVVHQQYPQDVDIAAMYAESLMDMHPWDLWTKQGEPRPWTPAILEAIRVAIEMDPKHPGGHHFNIHAWEASNTPEKANPSCKVFDDGLVSEAGHLVHMPSHIYINTGEYHLGSLSNIRAVEKDSLYVTQCHAYGAYPLAYYPHNYHFLAATSTLSGKSDWAILAAEKMSDMTAHKGMLVPELATLQHYYSIPDFIYVKLALWDKILNDAPVDTSLIYPMTIRHYARGMAFNGKGDLENAKRELAELKIMADLDTLEALTIWGINPLSQIAAIAVHVLEGEIAAKEKRWDESIASLEKGVALEDQLNYDEPPDWFFSVRHHLGDVLINAGRAVEAISVYEADLVVFPKNGWALSGLKKAYEESRQTEKAKETNDQLAVAWQHADVRLDGSRVVR